MALTNPYKPKVHAHKDIFTDDDELYDKQGKWGEYFGNNNPIYLEIGTGLGNFFSNECSKNPDINFIGMEIKYKRCFNTAEKSIQKGASNFVVLRDYGQNIDKIVNNGEIDQVYIFFPDPWGKKDRQKKHRIFQKEFLENIHKALKPGGKVIFKTDHKPYFDDTIELLDSMDIWKLERLTNDYEKDNEEFDIKNITEFEQIFRGERLQINYVELVKQ